MSQIRRTVAVLCLIELFMHYQTGISTVDAFVCNSTRSFPHPNDCRKFYHCYLVGKKPYLFNCPPDTQLYQAASSSCVNVTNKEFIAACSRVISPSPTTSPSRSLSSSVVILPSSGVFEVYSQYTSLVTQIASTSTPLAKPMNILKRKWSKPTYTIPQRSSSQVVLSKSIATPVTYSSSVNYFNETLCKSMTLDEKVTCFRNETNKVKEQINNSTSTTIIENLLKATASDAGNILEALGSHKNRSVAINAFDIIGALEEMWKGVMKRLTNSNKTIRITTKSLVFESVDVHGPYRFPELATYDRFNDTITDHVSDYIQLPQKLMSRDKYPCRSASALYLNLHSLVPVRINDTNHILKLNSRVISMLLCVPVKEILEGHVIIVMKHLKALADNEYTYCAFWDFSISTVHGNGAWSRKGCHVVTEHSNQTHTMCACDHLTNFAILMGSSKRSMSNANQFALSVITYVGCSLSLFGAIGAIASFVLFTRLSSDRHIIHGNLLISIAISQTIFLAGIERTQNKIQCKLTAIMLHYFYLASFGWMLCEGLHLYTMVVKVFNLSSRIYHYIVLAWGVPALIVFISAASRYSDYGTSTSCWISAERNTLLAFIIPVAATILVNMVILAMVLHEICGLQTSGRTCMGDIVRSTLKSLAVLFPLLGVTWVFGLLVFATHSIVFQYLFALFNTMQGFFIFLLHCLFNSEIRKNFKRKKQSWKSLRTFLHIRKRLSASSVVPVAHRSSLSEKASTFKASSEQRGCQEC